MKKLRLSFLLAFAIIGASCFAQSSDIGYDWDTSQTDPDKLIAASSSVSFIENQLSYTVNFGLDYQISFEIGGSGLSRAASHNAVYISNSSYPSSTAFSYVQLANGINAAYFEGYVNSDKEISSLKINGATASTSSGTDGGILFSDATPFDGSKVTGYTTIAFPACRAGGDGIILDAATIPASTKSFRLYGRAQVVPAETGSYFLVTNSGTDDDGNPVTPEGAIVVGSGTASVRLAYTNATISSASSIGSIDVANKTAMSRSYYNLTGCIVPESAAKGIMIQKSVYEDGTVSYDKVYINK